MSVSYISTETVGNVDFHKCQKCPFMSFSLKSMQYHVLSHTNFEDESAEPQALLSCPGCAEQLFTEPFLKDHLQAFHRMTAKDTAKLIALLKKEQQIKNLQMRVVVDAGFLLDAAEANVSQPKVELSSEKIERPPRPPATLRCGVQNCGVKLKSQKSLDYHRSCHRNATKDLFCVECKQQQASVERLHNHLWKSHRIDLDLHACDQCPYRVYSLSRLNNVHRKIHSDEKNYACVVCAKAFKNTKQLRKHRAIHRKKDVASKKVKCEICQRELNGRSLLAAHMKIVHEKTNLFSCKYCSYSSSLRSLLVLHMRSHTGEKPYVCELCNFRTSNKCTLRRHAMRHSQRKNYKCEHCDYSCIQASSIKSHIKLKHPGVKTDLLNACRVCSYTTVNRSNYLIHLIAHQKDPESEIAESIREEIFNLQNESAQSSKDTDKDDASSSLDTTNDIKVRNRVLGNNDLFIIEPVEVVKPSDVETIKYPQSDNPEMPLLNAINETNNSQINKAVKKAPKISVKSNLILKGPGNVLPTFSTYAHLNKEVNFIRSQDMYCVLDDITSSNQTNVMNIENAEANDFYAPSHSQSNVTNNNSMLYHPRILEENEAMSPYCILDRPYIDNNLLPFAGGDLGDSGKTLQENLDFSMNILNTVDMGFKFENKLGYCNSYSGQYMQLDHSVYNNITSDSINDMALPLDESEYLSLNDLESNKSMSNVYNGQSEMFDASILNSDTIVIDDTSCDMKSNYICNSDYGG